MMVDRPEMVTRQEKVDHPMKKVPTKLDANGAGVIATLRNKIKERAEEES